MSEKNWALGVNGAQVHDVSNEASHVASTAANLLNDAEDQLWVSGDAPQHVTIRLSPSHPPLHYSGWYVWHDYMTNPKRVEVSSGEHPDRMAAILVSEALPGAGTQIWRLPVPIPSHHLYVRFKILETFGKGPTYMNHVVLFASDPGPRYRHISSAAAPIGASSSTNQDVTATATVSASSGGSYGIRTAQQDKVGVFLHTSSGGGGGGGATTSTTTTTATTAGVGRVSQLLKDLDEDIRSLRPIKSLSPSKNMLLYLPQDPSPQLLLQEEGGLGEDTMDEEFLASDFRDEHQHQHQQHHQQHQPPVSCCGVDHTAQQHHHHNALAQPAASSTPSVPAHVMDSIRTLEKTVAALTQTVNHQKEDIAMMKRLLLQRAAEQRREESRRSAADAAVTTQLGAAPATSTPSPAIHHGGGGGGVSSLSANGYKLRHNNIDIEFPEDALRGFVESVMADKLRRQMKKSETRLIGRVDTYMREVIQCITDAVDERVQNHLLMQQQQQQQQQMLQLPEQLPAAARIPPRAALHSAAVAGGSSSYNTPSRQPDGSQAAAAGSAVPSPILPSSGADYYRKPATHPYSPSVQSFFNNLQPPTGSAAPISIIKDTSLSDQGGRR